MRRSFDAVKRICGADRIKEKMTNTTNFHNPMCFAQNISCYHDTKFFTEIDNLL